MNRTWNSKITAIVIALLAILGFFTRYNKSESRIMGPKTCDEERKCTRTYTHIRCQCHGFEFTSGNEQLCYGINTDCKRQEYIREE